MANNFTLVLDTTGPSSPSITLDAGSTYATDGLVEATISTADSSTTGYQMKLWGDIDLDWGKSNGIFNSSASGTTESNALWISYTTSKQLQLSDGDGSKTVYLKIRDDVHNVSSQASDSIILDTTRPVVTIAGPDVTRISKQPGKDVCSFSFTVDSVYNEFKVKVVSSVGANESSGVVIGTANGSVNMSGDEEGQEANVPVNCSIKGADLEEASPGDGSKIIKVFAKDEAGNWSI